MRPWIRRMVLAAVVGLGGGAGASAQAPQPLPPAPGGVPPVAAPHHAPAVTVAPGAMSAAPAYAAPAPVYGNGGGCGTDCGTAGYGGCDSCAPGPRAKHGKLSKSRWTIGEGCANPVGCGNLASERTFLWGGCNQFFTPGNKCGGGGHFGNNGGGLFSRLHGACAQGAYGAGGAGNVSTCCYGTYLNR